MNDAPVLRFTFYVLGQQSAVSQKLPVLPQGSGVVGYRQKESAERRPARAHCACANAAEDQGRRCTFSWTYVSTRSISSRKGPVTAMARVLSSHSPVSRLQSRTSIAPPSKANRSATAGPGLPDPQTSRCVANVFSPIRSSKTMTATSPSSTAKTLPRRVTLPLSRA